jgi:uncharacterized protein with ACT and thioredoxin-like domain
MAQYDIIPESWVTLKLEKCREKHSLKIENTSRSGSCTHLHDCAISDICVKPVMSIIQWAKIQVILLKAVKRNVEFWSLQFIKLVLNFKGEQ